MADSLPFPATRDQAGSMPLAGRKQALANVLDGKVEQGYTIEDRTDTAATLVSRGRRGRHWFGLTRNGDELRQNISIDSEGAMAMRKLEG